MSGQAIFGTVGVPVLKSHGYGAMERARAAHKGCLPGYVRGVPGKGGALRSGDDSGAYDLPDLPD